MNNEDDVDNVSEIKVDNAIKKFQDAMERNPEGDRTKATELAPDDAYAKTKYEQAIENFSKAIEHNPEV